MQIELLITKLNEVFNNRELALVIWVFVVIILLFKNGKMRSSLFDVLKAALNIKLIVLYILMMLYTTLIVYGLYFVGFWEIFLLKDTIIWFIFTAIISVFRAIDKADDLTYFKVIIKDNIKFILLFEFIVNFYTFSLPIELILVPVLFFVTIFVSFLDIMPEYQDEKYVPVKKFFNFINIILGIYIVLNSIILAINDLNNLQTIDTLKSLLLPSILSLLFMGFIYFFVLWSAYEQIFIRIKFGEKKSKRLIAYAKLKILLACNINFNKAKRFWRSSGLRIISIKNKADVIEVIKHFSNKEV